MRTFRTPPRLETVDYRQIRTYLVTFCVARRSRAFEHPTLASIAARWIQHFRNSGFYWLYGFVVMPDHVHVVMRPQRAGTHLSTIVAMIKSASLVEIRRYSTGFRWQRGYHERIVREADDIEGMVDYVLQNPARAGLVRPDQLYPFAGVIDSWR